MFRYRPHRLGTTELHHPVTCTFRVDKHDHGPLRVLDLSPTGVGLDVPEAMELPPGSLLEELTLHHRGRPVWQGEGMAVYQVREPQPRVGVRFTSNIFSLGTLQVGETVFERVEEELELQRRSAAMLPAQWRASVAEVQHLLESVRELLETETQKRRQGASPLQHRDERTLFEAVFERWGPAYHARLTDLHAQSAAFGPEAAELGAHYARRRLLPLLYPCPMHRRAYEKPRGYAGDYRLMSLYFSDEYEGDGLYGRFLHFVAQRYTLGRTVVARERTMREAIERTLAQGSGPSRIISLACGPAIEVQRAVEVTKALRGPVEFILIDQDEEALQHCNEAIARSLLAHHRGRLPVDLNCLHFSVRQLLKPQTDAELEVATRVLSNIDLVYSSGLFDYLPAPVARSLLTKLYDMLRPGGRLLVGNLRAVPDTTWIMDYVISWHLQYRNEPDMLALTTQLTPPPESVAVTTDETDACLFLEARKPR